MSIDSVRLALPGEAAAIAAIQRRGWEQTLPGMAAELQRSITLDQMTESWLLAILKPPLAEYRVLVAVSSQPRIVGFAAIGPSDDPDAEASADGLVVEFVIDPAAQRQGHGSRLLNAVADTLKADGFTRASWWVATTDDALRLFVTDSGWASDGAHRELETPDGSGRLKQVRLVTALS